MTDKVNTLPQRKTIACSLEIFMHLLAWLFVFSSPVIFSHSQTGISVGEYLRWCFMPFMVVLVFYLNYFLLAPRLFMKGHGRAFLIAEVLVIVAVVAIIHEVVVNVMPHPAHPEPPVCSRKIPDNLFILRDLVTVALVSAFGVACRLSHGWNKAETARREAELGRRNAELQNLRNQISPHFLLNTLNNIYALTMFDSAKAQDAIQELSRLLRYLLYDNQAKTTNIQKETDFLKSYIKLMRMRMPATVSVNAQFSIPNDCDIAIAPLIFISLVENAFKHGVSPTDKSFINITLSVSGDGVVDFFCENSNHPKTRELGPCGIGLKNLYQRLENLYKNHYHWSRGVTDDGKTYRSHLIIQTQ